MDTLRHLVTLEVFTCFKVAAKSLGKVLVCLVGKEKSVTLNLSVPSKVENWVRIIEELSSFMHSLQEGRKAFSGACVG